jgi:hypothetical protein
MNAIGGYFELELRNGNEYHKEAIRLNTGRNALELILKIKEFRKVFIPTYTCDVILEPFNKLRIDYEFYSIDENLEPVFNYDSIKKYEGFLYINYFGIKDSFIINLSTICRNLIIDNSQAFFSAPNPGIPTFYSCRKFFGVSDGAYLYLDGTDTSDLRRDVSLGRVGQLLKRIEYGAESGFNEFKSNENKLAGLPILSMSKLTKSILSNIDYDFIKKRRRENFLFLHSHLSVSNLLQIEFADECVPMVYPFLTDKVELKQRLIESKIFIATYWKNVLARTQVTSTENHLTKQLIPVPLDQRYRTDHLETILNVIGKK